MDNKYTAIYVEGWMSGSHYHSITKMKRIELHDCETIRDMLDREELGDTVQYLFHGHPPMQGEDERPIHEEPDRKVAEHD